jgi:DHA1 family tetracycline resistance protein-like MFS transporter
VKRFGERTTLVIGLGFGLAGFATWGLAPTGLIFWLGIPLLALWGFASAASLGLMSHLVGPSEQGQLQGANSSLTGIANLLGPILFTQIFALFIGERTDWHLPGAPFLLAALLLLFAAVLAWRTTQ